MTTLRNLIGTTEQETRRNAIKFAQENNYKVSEMYKWSMAMWNKKMAAIHKNGKVGNYSEAHLIYVVAETLETWV